MKKLLVIVLTAALLCTALAVAAFAAPSDVRSTGNVRFEGYVAGDGAGNSLCDWVGFWDTDPSDTESYNFFVGTLGAAYYNGNIYGYLYGYDGEGTLHDAFYIMDADTHFITYPEGASSGGEMVYGMAYNYADNKMYAMVDENNTYLAEVDLATGALTKTVDIDLGSYLGLQTFAIDVQGNFYALTFSAISARLVKINPATGALTELFATGLPTYYAQSMTCDPATGNIYWAQVDGANTASNGLYRINVSGQSVTYLGQIGTNFEITCLVVIPDYTAPEPTTEPTTEPTPEPTTEPTPAPTEDPQPSALLGDVNTDGSVDFADVSFLYMYMLGQYMPTAQGVINSDLDGDGSVNFNDITNLYAMLLAVE